VAIPEGPLLPVAVLVVHALNAASNRQKYAVLVPIEPSEAKERNKHILDDAKPAMILAVPGNDMDRLRELVSDGDSDAPRIVDFVHLLKHARRTLDVVTEGKEIPMDDHRNDMSLQETVMSIMQDLFQHQEDESITTLYVTKLSRISHIVYTSGTTGRPKGCVSSTASLLHYLRAKNNAHDITSESTILLASSLSFDPCLSDILATFHARATLAIAPRSNLMGDLTMTVQRLQVTHVLCTPTLWSLTAMLPSHSSSSPPPPSSHSLLQRVALGGEPIPKRLVQLWARADAEENNPCRLLATYGVTEACVYQTCGEVFSKGDTVETKGQNVGRPLEGTSIRICMEDIQDALVDVDDKGMPGEVVLYGKQVDFRTGYLHRPELRHKFVAETINDQGDVRYHYRTGDRGIIDLKDGSLTILGRIVGEEGMIKINGVRVELEEIEAAIVDDTEMPSSLPVVRDCLALLHKDESQSSIHAYCVLEDDVWKQLGVDSHEQRRDGSIISEGPLWTLLRGRCANRLKAACIPSVFVAISRLPLSPTGKRDRSKLPALGSCHLMEGSSRRSEPLRDHGKSGSVVAKTIVDVLNLQPCQEQLLTTAASFAMMGGDSLSAVLIARTLYALHQNVQNSRFLGGEYGQLPEPFTVANILRARTLGDYVDLLDRNNVCSPAYQPQQGTQGTSENTEPSDNNDSNDSESESHLYEALVQAVTLGQSSIAIGLLTVGADPNYGAHGGRIGKTSGRLEQRAKFKASPLHIACVKGDHHVVKMLLQCGASFKSPNANGLYPLHLAAGTLVEDGAGTEEEALRRLKCVKALLNVGCPLLMRDANKQSILHVAARAGHFAIVEYCINEYFELFENGSETNNRKRVPPSHFINWYDRWFRTAVHWATLNGRVQTLHLLLDRGCNPSPSQPKANKHTSMANETPLEMCDRVHGETNVGIEMRRLLTEAIKQWETC
jgi:acyl-CoA synthetase (AMP-forming)/AMP-acid ligase II/ankyrin repeat protein